MTVKEVREGSASELAVDGPEHLRTRAVLRRDRSQMPQAERTLSLLQDLTVVISQRDRAKATPVVRVVRDNAEMAFGFE
jgi:hypothetical protein